MRFNRGLSPIIFMFLLIAMSSMVTFVSDAIADEKFLTTSDEAQKLLSEAKFDKNHPWVGWYTEKTPEDIYQKMRTDPCEPAHGLCEMSRIELEVFLKKLTTFIKRSESYYPEAMSIDNLELLTLIVRRKAAEQEANQAKAEHEAVKNEIIQKTPALIQVFENKIKSGKKLSEKDKDLLNYIKDLGKPAEYMSRIEKLLNNPRNFAY